MNLFKRLFGARAQYLMLTAREEEFKSKSKRLGIQSIILSVVGLIGVIVFVVMGTLIARNVDSSATPILSFFGAIVFYAFALAFFLSCSLTSTSFANYQRHLNKNKIGLASLIISLVFILICLLFTIIFVVIML